jgi:hypothetical protein
MAFAFETISVHVSVFNSDKLETIFPVARMKELLG